ncbi:MAG: hypothetical protein KJ666_09680 [Bacteroidetes bacterium]|nr:hypothetical protein [Bacteroidota bacterium]MBU2583986.1 hypothetical protein [Bacteroidota bacterium]
MKKKFWESIPSGEAQIYHSGFCTYVIEAENETEAIEKARLQTIDKNELLSNLESWKEADTANEIKNAEAKK